ncbi:hypothetical protein [Enterobacter cloacae complex sp. 339J8]|uniref:hypothetical protein n=1 Tax=Enterobacter cloacae complex sp. 339J8 TaxID=3395869 RepID=UPI003CF8FE2C
MAGSSPSLPDGFNPSAAIVQSASDVQCSRLLKTTQALSSSKDRPLRPGMLQILENLLKDETIRYGFIALGAVIERTGLPVTTPLPEYAMSKAFAALFNVDLIRDDLEALIRSWQNSH